LNFHRDFFKNNIRSTSYRNPWLLSVILYNQLIEA